MGKGKKRIREQDEEGNIGVFTTDITQNINLDQPNPAPSTSINSFSSYSSGEAPMLMITDFPNSEKDDLSFINKFNQGLLDEESLLKMLVLTSRGHRYLLFHIFTEGMLRDEVVDQIGDQFYLNMKEKMTHLPILDVNKTMVVNIFIEKLIDLDRTIRNITRSTLQWLNISSRIDQAIFTLCIGDLDLKFFAKHVIWLGNSTESQEAFKSFTDKTITASMYPSLFPVIAALVIYELTPATAVAFKSLLLDYLKEIVHGNGIQLKMIIKQLGLNAISVIYAVCFRLIRNGVLPKIKHKAIKTSDSIHGLAVAIQPFLISVEESTILFHHTRISEKLQYFEIALSKSKTIHQVSLSLQSIPDIEGM